MYCLNFLIYEGDAFMKLGIPKGLLYYRYEAFFKKFFNGLGMEIIVSPDTNKEILNLGTSFCIDEACLPVKVFHGHAAFLRDKCDIIFIPRIMSIMEKEFICPKFCGLPEMIKNSIPGMPLIIDNPIYAYSEKSLFKSFYKIGRKLGKSSFDIKESLLKAIEYQENFRTGINDTDTSIKVALAGHPYNVYDSFVNMNLIKKLRKLGIGIITEEFISEACIRDEIDSLFKRPFWSFARTNYGFCKYSADSKQVNGIIYISSFACGIDSVIIDLIKENIPDFPMLVLKIDEHTGEAGFDTRLEAFSDMLERRISHENKLPSSW